MGRREIVLLLSALIFSVAALGNESRIERLLDREDLIKSSIRKGFSVGYGERRFTEEKFEKHNYKAAEFGYSMEFFPNSLFSTTTKADITLGIKKDQTGDVSKYDQRYYNVAVSQRLNINSDFGTFIFQTFIGGAIAYNYYANVLNVESNEKEYEIFELTSGQSYEYFVGMSLIFESISPYIKFGVNRFKPEFFEIANVQGLTQTQSAQSYTGADLEQVESTDTVYGMLGFTFIF